jgi:hypothetical protein
MTCRDQGERGIWISVQGRWRTKSEVLWNFGLHVSSCHKGPVAPQSVIAQGVFSVRRRLQMHTTAIAILAGMFLAIFLSFLPIFLSGGRAAQEQARARRMAEHRMNARLLRLNL